MARPRDAGDALSRSLLQKARATGSLGQTAAGSEAQAQAAIARSGAHQSQPLPRRNEGRPRMPGHAAPGSVGILGPGFYPGVIDTTVRFNPNVRLDPSQMTVRPPETLADAQRRGFREYQARIRSRGPLPRAPSLSRARRPRIGGQ